MNFSCLLIYVWTAQMTQMTQMIQMTQMTQMTQTTSLMIPLPSNLEEYKKDIESCFETYSGDKFIDLVKLNLKEIIYRMIYFLKASKKHMPEIIMRGLTFTERQIKVKSCIDFWNGELVAKKNMLLEYMNIVRITCFSTETFLEYNEECERMEGEFDELVKSWKL